MPKLLLTLTVWLTQKHTYRKKQKKNGDLDSLTLLLLEPKNKKKKNHQRRFIFHRIKNDYLSSNRVESTLWRLGMCCEVLATFEQFSISCVEKKPTRFLRLIRTELRSTASPARALDSTCAYSWSAHQELVINSYGFFFFLLFFLAAGMLSDGSDGNNGANNAH